MNINNLPHGVSVWKINEVEEAAAQERVRQLFFIV